MANVLFQFRAQASEEDQDRLRKEILELPGVRNVGRISPNATKDMLRRAWYADVADDGAASDLATRLRNRDDVESANVPAKRGLL